MYLNERNRLCSKKLAALKGLVVVKRRAERDLAETRSLYSASIQYKHCVSTVALRITRSGYLLVASLGIVFSSMVTKRCLSLGGYIISKFPVSSLKLLVCFLELFQQHHALISRMPNLGLEPFYILKHEGPDNKN